jgi:hypothetical protein
VSPPATPKKIASALPRSSTGYAATTIARAAGNMIAAPAPWITRKTMIHGSASDPVGVAPQSAEAIVNTAMPSRTMFLWPAMSAIRPAEGEQRREREQVAVDHPLHAGRREAEVFLKVRDRDRDDRLVDERHRDGEDHRQDEALVRCGVQGLGL